MAGTTQPSASAGQPPSASVGAYLTLAFDGYFMCRLATDPDPSNEERGRSGYTMALTHERPLDQIIRMQADDYVREHLRPPAGGKKSNLPREVGVSVRSVNLGGKVWPAGEHLIGAKVDLKGPDGVTPGAIFESRNNIVGSDDSLAFVITPFDLVIEQTGERPVTLRAIDYLNPVDPDKQTWEIENPALYTRRFPTKFDPASLEVMQAISVFDGYEYFRVRREFLTKRIAELTQLLEGPDGASLMLPLEQAKSRLYQLEFWGDRVINKLGFRLEWEFEVNGPQTADGDLGGRADVDQPWHVRMWCGGWDGDLLLGYLRGSLSIPFEENPAVEAAG
jgi:hypothetical protein